MAYDIDVKENEITRGEFYIQEVIPNIRLNILKAPVKKNISSKGSKKLSFNQASRLYIKLNTNLKLKNIERFIFINKLINYKEKYFLRDYPQITAKEFYKFNQQIKMRMNR